jgi:hypothetical protein
VSHFDSPHHANHTVDCADSPRGLREPCLHRAPPDQALPETALAAGGRCCGNGAPFPSRPQCDRARSRVVSCTHAGDFSREFSCGSIGKISLGVKKFGGWLRPQPTLLWPSGRPHNATPYARSSRLGALFGFGRQSRPGLTPPRCRCRSRTKSGAGNDQ